MLLLSELPFATVLTLVARAARRPIQVAVHCLHRQPGRQGPFALPDWGRWSRGMPILAREGTAVPDAARVAASGLAAGSGPPCCGAAAASAHCAHISHFGRGMDGYADEQTPTPIGRLCNSRSVGKPDGVAPASPMPPAVLPMRPGPTPPSTTAAISSPRWCPSSPSSSSPPATTGRADRHKRASGAVPGAGGVGASSVAWATASGSRSSRSVSQPGQGRSPIDHSCRSATRPKPSLAVVPQTA